jgi:hypothetical protein
MYVLVMCAVNYSTIRMISKDIYAYVVVIAHFPVRFVINESIHSGEGPFSYV